MSTLINNQLSGNDGKMRKDIPVHERKILENIRSSNKEYCRNLKQNEKAKYKMKGKMEIIEILKYLNMISNDSYALIQRESGKVYKTYNEIVVHF